MKKYLQIDTTIDPKIIGVKNETKQVLIDYKSLEKSDFFKIHYPNIFEHLKDINIIKEFDLGILRGKLFKKAIPTDLMRFSPFLKGCCFIVSEKFTEALKNFGISKEEFSIKKIEIEELSDNFYLFFTPIVGVENIDFKKSIIYTSNLFETKPDKYLDLKNLNDFQQAKQNFTFVSFERITLPLTNKRVNKHIYYLPEVTPFMFFSEELFNFLISQNLSNIVLRTQVKVELLLE